MPKRKTPLPFPRSGECIRYYRELRGYTQAALAEMVGLSPYYLGYIERGRQMASIQYLVRLAHVLAVSVEDLLEPQTEKLDKSADMRKVMVNLIGKLDDDECDIAYELLTRIVPMIRARRKD